MYVLIYRATGYGKVATSSAVQRSASQSKSKGFEIADVAEIALIPNFTI